MALGAQLNVILGTQPALAILGDVADSLTAAGTSAATAYAITATTNVFTTVAAGTGCILPSGGKGDRIHVANLGISALMIYPPTSGTMNGKAQAVMLPPAKAVDFVCRNTIDYTVCITA